jgi:hypothetical protein
MFTLALNPQPKEVQAISNFVPAASIGFSVFS